MLRIGGADTHLTAALLHPEATSLPRPGAKVCRLSLGGSKLCDAHKGLRALPSSGGLPAMLALACAANVPVLFDSCCLGFFEAPCGLRFHILRFRSICFRSVVAGATAPCARPLLARRHVVVFVVVVDVASVAQHSHVIPFPLCP